MKKITLAHLPTPLWHHPALDPLVGAEVWVKRDDMTSGAAAGNKIRKLEYLLGDALARQATVILTCGGVQSNHARATAIAARELGLRSILFLRTDEGRPPAKSEGNLLLDRLVGAELRFVDFATYRNREAVMRAAAESLAKQGERPYVIPEGGSNGVGLWGYVDAMEEIRGQLDRRDFGAPSSFDAVVAACGSGGTSAGCVLGARAFGVAPIVHAMAVCEDAPTFTRAIEAMIASGLALRSAPGPRADLCVHDQWKGPAYGVASPEQKQFLTQVARTCGLILDPVYTGKALFGLSQLFPKPKRVLFIHTGGLPGLLADPEALALLHPEGSHETK